MWPVGGFRRPAKRQTKEDPLPPLPRRPLHTPMPSLRRLDGCGCCRCLIHAHGDAFPCISRRDSWRWGIHRCPCILAKGSARTKINPAYRKQKSSLQHRPMPPILMLLVRWPVKLTQTRRILVYGHLVRSCASMISYVRHAISEHPTPRQTRLLDQGHGGAINLTSTTQIGPTIAAVAAMVYSGNGYHD